MKDTQGLYNINCIEHCYVSILKLYLHFETLGEVRFRAGVLGGSCLGVGRQRPRQRISGVVRKWDVSRVSKYG